MKLKFSMIKRLQLSTVFLLLLAITAVNGQEKEASFPSSEEEYEKQYQRNILKTQINGVYIPQDLTDAFKTILELSTPEALNKFKMGEEAVVVNKLKLGIGRWMILNWNFYEGSRFSHLLKEKGLLHPEDMSSFMITTLHRHLNESDLNEEELIIDLNEKRRDLAKQERDGLDEISTQTIKHEKPEEKN